MHIVSAMSCLCLSSRFKRSDGIHTLVRVVLLCHLVVIACVAVQAAYLVS